MIAARLPRVAVHALLHDGPCGVIGHEEAVQIEIETVLHGGAIDLGDESAGAGETDRVDAYAVAERCEFLGRLARMSAAAAADINSELGLEGFQAALEGPDDAGGDAGGVPVHAHHGPERLEPERVRKPAQELAGAVVVHDRLADHGAELGHARA
jgi:hypothetical protein